MSVVTAPSPVWACWSQFSSQNGRESRLLGFRCSLTQACARSPESLCLVRGPSRSHGLGGAFCGCCCTCSGVGGVPPRGEVGGCHSGTAGMRETALGVVLCLILSYETTDQVSQGGIGGVQGLQCVTVRFRSPQLPWRHPPAVFCPLKLGVLPGGDCAGPDARGTPLLRRRAWCSVMSNS